MNWTDLSEHKKHLKEHKILIGVTLIVVIGLYGFNVSSSLHEFNEADIQFMQRMSIHHDQAIKMSELAPKRTNNSQLLELAENISTVQGREHRQMETMVENAGYNPHPEINERMGGMATKQEMQTLKNSIGKEFNLLYLNLMIEHHVGGVEMAEKEVENGKSQKVMNMAEKMIEVQQREIKLMRNWQQQWNSSSS